MASTLPNEMGSTNVPVVRTEVPNLKKYVCAEYDDVPAPPYRLNALPVTY